MFDQPMRHRGFMVTVAVLTLATVPFAFVGRAVRMLWGVPLWLWWSMGSTTVLSGIIAWGVLRFWKDDNLD